MRPGASSAHLGLSWLRLDAPPAPGPGASPAELRMAVAKRLAPSAPVRNMIRRVMREAWRAAVPPGTPVVALARLRALPQAHEPVASRKGAKPSAADRLRARPTDRQLKRLLRAEADQVFARMLRKLADPSPTVHPSSSQPPPASSSSSSGAVPPGTPTSPVPPAS